MNFTEWLESKDACAPALEWVSKQIDTSPSALLQTCPRGDWILWVYEKAGYDFETLSPVVYAAVNRAFGYAAQELDKAGVKHDLRKHIITDGTTAAVARAAAYTAYDYAAATARATARATAYTARAAAAAAARAAARDAAYAAYAADAADAAAADTEHKKCADDCREFLPPLIIPGVES